MCQTRLSKRQSAHHEGIGADTKAGRRWVTRTLLEGLKITRDNFSLVCSTPLRKPWCSGRPKPDLMQALH